MFQIRATSSKNSGKSPSNSRITVCVFGYTLTHLDADMDKINTLTIDRIERSANIVHPYWFFHILCRVLRKNIIVLKIDEL